MEVVDDKASSSKKKGLPSIVELFPEISNIIRDFMTANGFVAAQERRRNTTGKSVGTSVPQILQHLLNLVEAPSRSC